MKPPDGPGVDVSHRQILRDREIVRDDKLRQRQDSKSEIRSGGDYEIRLLEILEEGWRGEDYFVRARIEVISSEEAEIKLGYLWKVAGRPAIELELSETRGRRRAGKPSK